MKLEGQDRTASTRTMRTLFRKYGVEEIDKIISKLESSSEPAIVAGNYRLDVRQALPIAYKIKGEAHLNLLYPRTIPDFGPLAKSLELTHLNKIDVHSFSKNPQPWSYINADDLVAKCPNDIEIQQIRDDFNIYFEKGLVDQSLLLPWGCTDHGSESSIMLSMYNIFRLFKCIPFTKSFIWDAGYGNLYDWLKSLGLTAIGFFYAQSNEYSCGWNKRVYLRGNDLADPMYRDIINPQTGVGIIDFTILLVHEAWHAGRNIPHNCGECGCQDTDLNYMGAWSVQYYLLKMLAENTGDFFSDYVKQGLIARAAETLKTRFCNVSV